MEEKKKNNNFDFKKRKENTVHSLFEVEHFLGDLKSVMKGFRAYKFLKK